MTDPDGLDPRTRANVHRVVRAIGAAGKPLVLVDGRPAVGKSFLGREIADASGLPLISLDSYLDPHRGTFLEALDYEQLQSDLADRSVVVEGICGLAVMERLRLRPTLHVVVTSPDSGFVPPRGGSHPWIGELREYWERFDPITAADVRLVNLLPDQPVPERHMTQSDIDIAYINAKTRLAIALAFGGLLTLLTGLVILIFAPSMAGQEALINLAGLDISAKGMGAVVMGTSVAWGYLAYKARPKYSRKLETYESGDPDGRYERRRIESSTMTAVEPDTGE